MLPPRFPVLSALLVLLMAAGRCTAAALRRGSGTRSDGRLVDGRSALDPVSRYPRTRTEAAAVTEHRGKTPERGSRSHHGAEGHLKEQRQKEMFITHLTGPLYFSPKCKRPFNRLYHNTRDCTIPAYYKRCALLLTRLANSPHCAER